MSKKRNIFIGNGLNFSKLQKESYYKKDEKLNLNLKEEENKETLNTDRSIENEIDYLLNLPSYFPSVVAKIETENGVYEGQLYSKKEDYIVLEISDSSVNIKISDIKKVSYN